MRCHVPCLLLALSRPALILSQSTTSPVPTVAPITSELMVALSTGTPTLAPVASTPLPTTSSGDSSPSSTPSAPPKQTETPSMTPSMSMSDEIDTTLPSTSPGPTEAPVAGGTPAPTTQVDKTTADLTMTLIGITKVENTASWSKSTTDFFKTQYENGNMTNTRLKVTFTNQTTSAGKRNMRGLQIDSVVVTYKQDLTYSTSDSSLTLDKALQFPLSTPEQQVEYVAALKQLDSYSDSGLTSVSAISLPDNIDPNPNPDTGGGGVPQWTINEITAVFVSIVVLILVVCVLFDMVMHKRRENNYRNDPTLLGSPLLHYLLGYTVGFAFGFLRQWLFSILGM